jgi:hypothetical protein
MQIRQTEEASNHNMQVRKFRVPSNEVMQMMMNCEQWMQRETQFGAQEFHYKFTRNVLSSSQWQNSTRNLWGPTIMINISRLKKIFILGLSLTFRKIGS